MQYNPQFLDLADEIEDVFDELTGNGSDDTIFILFFVMLGLGIIVPLIAALIARSARKASDNQYPARREFATLIERRLGAYGNDTLVFQLQSGERVTLETSDYKDLIVGDSGSLSWQGRTLFGFHRRKVPSQPLSEEKASDNSYLNDISRKLNEFNSMQTESSDSEQIRCPGCEQLLYFEKIPAGSIICPHCGTRFIMTDSGPQQIVMTRSETRNPPEGKKTGRRVLIALLIILAVLGLFAAISSCEGEQSPSKTPGITNMYGHTVYAVKLPGGGIHTVKNKLGIRGTEGTKSVNIVGINGAKSTSYKAGYFRTTGGAWICYSTELSVFLYISGAISESDAESICVKLTFYENNSMSYETAKQYIPALK